MTKLTLTNYAQGHTTVLENEFIDQHMAKANGEYVKVYLLVLRHMNSATGMLSVSEIADCLDCTEKDVHRALKYWQKQGLLEYTDKSKAPEQKAVKQETVREESLEQPIANDNMIPQQQENDGQESLQEVLFVAEQYLGKTLSVSDIDTIAYFFETLHMSTELIDYLIEYCVDSGHKSMHYIQKVALSWHEQGITTVTEAKSNSVNYNKNCYSVLNAYGIKGRAPASSEITFIRRWNEEYGFTLDIILEACDRTMNTIHQPSFEYTDTILKRWLDKGVRKFADIQSVDAEYLIERERKKKASANAAKQAAVQQGGKPNKFNNFDGREYNMNDLERQLVQQ